MKRYLLVFWLDKSRAEHGRIKSEIDTWSSGTPQIAFTNSNRNGASLIAWLVISVRPLADLNVDRCLFREDKYLAMEIGSEFAGDRFGDARQWLWQTRPR